MFQDNLIACRKAKGMTQEELAVRLHVVRQTVSKWEKGKSVPDAEVLVRLSEVLEVPVSRLLDTATSPESPADQVAEQLARINEQLAVKNLRARRIWRVVAGILIGIAIFLAALISLNIVAFHTYSFNPDVESQSQVAPVDPDTERSAP